MGYIKAPTTKTPVVIERIKNIPVYEWERARKRHIKKAMEESDVDDIFKFSVNDKDSLEVREMKTACI